MGWKLISFEKAKALFKEGKCDPMIIIAVLSMDEGKALLYDKDKGTLLMVEAAMLYAWDYEVYV